MFRIAVPARAAFALLAAACSQAATAPHGPDHIPVYQRAVTPAGTSFSRVEGDSAGALFAALRPDEWNGSLVLLLHGHVHVNEPLQLPPSATDRQFLIEPFGNLFGGILEPYVQGRRWKRALYTSCQTAPQAGARSGRRTVRCPGVHLARHVVTGDIRGL